MMAMIIQETTVVQPGASIQYNLYNALGSPTRPLAVICILNSAITSNSIAAPAFSTGTGWPAGTQIVVINNSTVTGATGSTGSSGSGTVGTASNVGGAGGTGGASAAGSSGGSAGSAGGTGGNATATDGGTGGSGGPAFQAQYSMSLVNNGSIVRGNGGPGGPGGGPFAGGAGGGGGGGGGGGTERYDDPGPAYHSGQNGGRGGDGITNAGRVIVGATFGDGGNGGAVGNAGSVGLNGLTTDVFYPPVRYIGRSTGAGGPAGAAGATASGSTGSTGTVGNAINGTSNITYAVAGTITGAIT